MLITTLILLINLYSLDAQTHIEDIDELITCLELRETNNIPDNTYSSEKILVWSAYPDCQARVQCNSFHNKVLNHCYGLNVLAWTGGLFNSPNAAFIYDRIVAEVQYTVIQSIHDVEVGDTIAIKYPPGQGTSGHIMFVHDVPALRIASAKLVPNTDQYGVIVVDSTSTYHGPLDTRIDNNQVGGVGRGEFRLYVDTNTEEIVGYTWSTYGTSKYEELGNGLVLVIGRFQYP
jgi:hypothetical protein